MRWLDNMIDSVDMNLSKLREIVEVKVAAVPGVTKIGHNLATEQQAPTKLKTP